VYSKQKLCEHFNEEFKMTEELKTCPLADGY